MKVEIDEIICLAEAAIRVNSMRDFKDFLNSIWDWSIFKRKKCFGGKITPMDLDCVVESRSYFFVICFKDHKETIKGISSLQLGERITYESLLYLRNVTLIIVNGTAKTERIRDLLVYPGGKSAPISESPSMENLCRIASQWFSWTRRQTNRSPIVGCKSVGEEYVPVESFVLN